MTRTTEREIGEIHAKVNEIHKTLMGNGQPGLVQNYTTLKSEVDQYKGAMTFISWFVGVFGVASIATIVALVRLYI